MLYNNQQDVQAAGEDAKIQVTTWYLLLHIYTFCSSWALRTLTELQ